MIHVEYVWKSYDGLDLFGQSWKPEGNIRGIICLVHGLGDHSSRYTHWAEKLVQENFAVLAFDYRGHGKSQGKRGHCSDYQNYMDDISVLINQAEIIFPGIPKVIYGHSLGGNLVLNYMLKRTPLVYGAIITSPWIELSFQPPKAKILAGKIVRMVAPGFSMDTNLKSEDLSSKNEIAEHYEKDSLVHGKITASNFLNILTAGEYILSNADQTYVQILLLHGKEDKITSYKASEKFANSAGDFVTLKLYDGMYHELHNEQNNEIVFQDILDWLSAL